MKKLVRGLLLAAVVGWLSFLCPTPYVLSAPGPSYDTGDLVHVEGVSTFSSRGRFLLMTVVNEPANLLFCLYTLFDRDAELSNKTRLKSQAQSGEDDGAGQMVLSQSVSISVALNYVMEQHPEMVGGLRVVSAIKEGPNAQTLKPGDILRTLEQQPLHNLRQMGATVAGRPPGSTVMARVERQGKILELPLKVWERGPRRLLGFHLAPVLQDNGRPLKIEIDSEEVSGASGGLVFALEVIDLLTREDLTQGRVVAATGTLDPWGEVGEVEGVRFKAIAAQRAGANLFLCPSANVAEIKAAAPDLAVVGVDSLEQALKALRPRP